LNSIFNGLQFQKESAKNAFSLLKLNSKNKAPPKTILAKPVQAFVQSIKHLINSHNKIIAYEAFFRIGRYSRNKNRTYKLWRTIGKLISNRKQGYLNHLRAQCKSATLSLKISNGVETLQRLADQQVGRAFLEVYIQSKLNASANFNAINNSNNAV